MEYVIFDLTNVSDIFITGISAGFIMGSIILVVGLGVHGLINIFKKI